MAVLSTGSFHFKCVQTSSTAVHRTCRPLSPAITDWKDLQGPVESMKVFDTSKCYSEASEVLHLHKRYLFQERALAGKALYPFRREWVWPDGTLLCVPQPAFYKISNYMACGKHSNVGIGWLQWP